MITQRLNIDGTNIVKQDGSLYPCWGHNYNNLNIPDVFAENEIIENVWIDNLYAKGGIFTITNIAWSYASGTGSNLVYNVTLTLAESISADTFTIGTDKITIAGSPLLTGTNIFGGASVNFSIEGAATDPNNNRQPISNINTSNKTITFQQKFQNFVDAGSVAVTSGIVGIGSIELDLAILNKLAKSKIIRICLQLDKFMLDDDGYNRAIDSSTGTEDGADVGGGESGQSGNIALDPYAVNSDQLDRLYSFLDLAAKYDLYVIVNGANSWVAGEQPNWLAFASEDVRWTAQMEFWKAVAERIKNHSAVAWYSLINAPIDQSTDTKITSYDSTAKQIIAAWPPNLGSEFFSTKFQSFLSEKQNKSGYILITNETRTKFVLAYYNNFVINFTTDLLFNFTGVELFQYYNYPTIDSDELANCYISFISKSPNIENIKIAQTTAGSKTAVLDVASDTTPFKQAGNDWADRFGFFGDTYTAALRNSSSVNYGGDPFNNSSSTNIGVTSKSNRFSDAVLALSPSVIQKNFGISNAVLSSNKEINGIPFGYGQVLKNYPNNDGQPNKINSINFGRNDLLLYGSNGGYNVDFFLQSLRVILSRLQCETVTEFTGSNFNSGTATEVISSSASGGSYWKTSTNQTVTFQTPSGFKGGTIGIGFMVENGGNAQATISVDGRTYNQSLISGTDVYKSPTNDPDYSALPVIKRIHNLPSGQNTVTIALSIQTGSSACLDYWQSELLSAPPIIVNSIDNKGLYASSKSVKLSTTVLPTASGTTYTYTTQTHHNFVVGQPVSITGITTGTNYQEFNKTFTVQSTPTPTTFTVTGTVSNPTATTVATTATAVTPGISTFDSTTETKQSPIVKWNQSIIRFIYAEFFNEPSVAGKRSVYFLNTEALFTSTDYDANGYLNNSGHSKLALNYSNLIIQDGLLPVYGVSVSGTTYTYTTYQPHKLGIGDQVYISGATPSNINGKYTVATVPTNYKFTVTGPSIISVPSVENATYAKQSLQPNTTYILESNNVPANSRISFTTGSTINDVNGLYTITLSNSNNVQTSSTPEPCKIVNNTQWIGPADPVTNRHYDAYLTITPTQRTRFEVTQQWVIKMRDAIREVDPYTFITVPTKLTTVGDQINASGSAAGSGVNNIGSDPANINSLVQIFSPHQSTAISNSNEGLVADLSTFSGYNKPVILEEGMLPLPSNEGSLRRAINYLIKSKRYLAGGLSNYEGYSYKNGSWYPWSKDVNFYQYLFNIVAPFLDDAPSDDSQKTSEIVNSYQAQLPYDKDVNKPRVTGRRYLFPITNRSSANFSPLNLDSYVPDNTIGLNIDGAYISQVQMTKNPNILPQYATTWFDSTNVANSAMNLNLNSFYTTSQQEILSLKMNAYLSHGPQMVLRNKRPSFISQTGTEWSLTSGTDYTAPVNGTGTTTLSNSITSTSGSITVTVASASAFASSGIILIDEEYMYYTSKSATTLTVASTGRGYFNTAPATHSSGATVRGITPLATSVVRASKGGSNGDPAVPASYYIDWSLASSSLPSGRAFYKFNTWVCLKVDDPRFAARVATNNTTLTGNTVLSFGTNNIPIDFGVGAFLYDSSGRIAPGAYIKSKTSNTVTMSEGAASTVGSGVYITATNAPQAAKIELRSSGGSTLYHSIIYKGNFFDSDARTNTTLPDDAPITYGQYDLVSYQPAGQALQIWQSQIADNRRTPGTGTQYWRPINEISLTPTGYVWIRMSFYYDGTQWINADTGAAISNSASFNPANGLRVRVSNANPYDPPTGGGINPRYISIAGIYGDGYTDGNVDPSGNKLLEARLYRTNEWLPESNATISLYNNSSNGWKSSPNEVSNTGQITQAALNAPMYMNFTPISTTTGVPSSWEPYSVANPSNLNIATGYVEVKVRETLARKGTPIVSMG